VVAEAEVGEGKAKAKAREALRQCRRSCAVTSGKSPKNNVA